MSFRAKDFFSDPDILNLCHAAAKGNSAKIKDLVNQGTDLSHAGRDGVYPLLWSLIANKLKGYQYLLEADASPNQLTQDHDSVMSFAAQHPEIRYLQLAVKHGGELNIRDGQKATPLILAAQKIKPENLLFLLQQDGVMIDAQDKAGWSALMHATSNNRPFLVEPLLKAGADPDQKDLGGMAARDIARQSAGAEVKALIAKVD